MKIKEIMTKEVTCVSPDDDISKVSDILHNNRFHGVPVVKNKKVVGLITESDFFLKNYDDIYFPTYIKFVEESRLSKSLPEKLKEKIKIVLDSKAKDIMTEKPFTFSAEDDIATLMVRIKKTKFTTFPVVDTGKNIIGIVTLADYLGMVGKNSRQMKNNLHKNYTRKIDILTGELGNFWQEQIAAINNKKIRTWKGLAFLGFIVITIMIIALLFIPKNQTSCTEESASFVPLECQQYSYGPWSECNPQNTQTREIIKKFPKNCAKGAIPLLIQSCK